MTVKIAAAEAAAALRARDARAYVSHSGGKDSQAMYALVSRFFAPERVVVVHADLGRVEHAGVQDHIHATTDHEPNVVTARGGDLLDRVMARHEKRPDVPPWPSARARWCTSDLKRTPIDRFIRGDLARRGKSLAVNVIGLRAEESRARKAKHPMTYNTRLSRAGREVWDWLPIHHLAERDVYGVIEGAGQKPHPSYAEGNDRLSCQFCILASANDLALGAQRDPSLYRAYRRIERLTGYTMFAGASLPARVATVRREEGCERAIARR